MITSTPAAADRSGGGRHRRSRSRRSPMRLYWPALLVLAVGLVLNRRVGR